MNPTLGSEDDSNSGLVASDWLRKDQESASDERTVVSSRVVGWTCFLSVIAILGNLAVPTLFDRWLDRQFEFEGASYHITTTFETAFFGLWIAEYVALWLWINSYIRSRIARWLLGLWLCAAITYSVVLGFSIGWGSIPIITFWFYMIGSLGFYVTINLLMKLFLRRSDFRWQPIQLGTGSRYSIRALLGTMTASAMFMLVIKLFPFDSSDGPDNVAFLFTLLGIWTAWHALAIPALIWLQLGAVFSRRRGRFVISFLVLAILGPAVSHLIGAWVFSWDPETEFPIELHQFVIAYSIELGLLAGVGLVLPLLPRERADEG